MWLKGLATLSTAMLLGARLASAQGFPSDMKQHYNDMAKARDTAAAAVVMQAIVSILSRESAHGFADTTSQPFSVTLPTDSGAHWVAYRDSLIRLVHARPEKPEDQTRRGISLSNM